MDLVSDDNHFYETRESYNLAEALRIGVHELTLLHRREIPLVSVALGGGTVAAGTPATSAGTPQSWVRSFISLP